MRKLYRESWTFLLGSQTLWGLKLTLSLFSALAPTKQFGFEFHMFISSLFVTTSRFPAAQGSSHLKPALCNSPWHYMTNCFPNDLPRCLFRFVTEPMNSLSMVASDSALPPDDHSWQLIMAQKFCFPHCSVFWQGWMSQKGMEDKWWQILSRILNILETASSS